MKRTLTALVLATLSLAACADDTPTDVGTPVTPEQPGVQYVAPFLPGRVIVRFSAQAIDPRASLPQRVGAARRAGEGAGVTGAEAMRIPGMYVLYVADGTELEAAGTLSEQDGVEFAEPDYLIEVIPCETGDCADPADFFLARKWDLHNTGAVVVSGVSTPTGAADADVDWLEAFDALGPAPAGSARIGIVDTGIRNTHLELAGRVVAAQNFATGYPATLIEDRDGHGTHVAGIAAAAGVSASGIAYGPGIQLINAKACELYLFPDGIVRTSCPTSSTANAIAWAVDQGADVINLSLGGSPLATSGSAAQQAALQYARANDVLPFCATGNDNFPAIAFPARFPECIGVGATTWGDTRASYSNYGPGTEIAAPGGDGGAGAPLGFILSLSRNADNLYTYKAGTSMATPQVVGLAALLFSQGVGDDDAVLARIKATADDLGTPGEDQVFGAGRINVCRALDPAQLTVVMPGAFNRTSNGVFTVEIHGVPGFDPARLDAADLRLGDGNAPGAAVALKGDAYWASLTDVDGDGDMDLVVKFNRPELAANVASGSTQLVLRGSVGCRRVEGQQAVNVIR